MNSTAGELLKWSIDYLASSGVDQPRLDCEILMAETLGCEGRQAVYFETGRKVSEKDWVHYRNMVERRGAREPIHYILGHQEFWSMDFKVSPQVLIPRPETEILVEQLLKLVRNCPKDEYFKILDIGTGSGNITIAVAREIPGCHVTAVDICENALAVAVKNSQTHRVASQITFLSSDLFEAIQKENSGPFDLIISNPPYIDTKKLEHLITDVKDFEPRLALDGGENGLGIYRKIIPQAGGFLNEQGWLILEIDFDQAEAVSFLIEETGLYGKPIVHPDYSGYPRVVTARKRAHG